MSELGGRQRDLDTAAAVLLSVGCADPFEVDAGLRLSCLWAAEQLRGHGAQVSDCAAPPDRDELKLVVADAVRVVESLPRDLRIEFDDTIVELRAAANPTG